MASKIVSQPAATGQPTRCKAGQLALTASVNNHRRLVSIERPYTPGERVGGFVYANPPKAGPAWVVKAIGVPLIAEDADGGGADHVWAGVFLDAALLPVDGELVGCWPRRHLITGEACHV